jgi:protein SCO1/2
MANLQRDLEEVELSDKVRLVLITYDPVYDTPARLKAYGADRGLEFTNAVMLRPGFYQFRQLLNEFQVGVDYRADGSIGHFIELLLIDHKGRFVRDYQGQVWDNPAVLDDLKRLLAEQEN